jgi:hypothetical protein
MPPNKKKGRSTNKQKKGKGGPRLATGSGAGLRGANQHPNSNNDVLKNMNNLPTFHGTTDATAGESTRHHKGGIYEQYKLCTRKFRDWMKETVSKLNCSNKMVSVNDLSHGADHILEQNIRFLNSPILATKEDATSSSAASPVVAPKDVMDSLSTSIRLREAVAHKYTQTDDASDAALAKAIETHQYMIDTLKYCQKLLIVSRRIVRVVIRDAKTTTTTEESLDTAADDIDAIGGRFNALLLDEMEDDDEAENDAIGVSDDSIRQHQFPQVQRPPEPEREINIEEDLIKGDDRFQAVALLNTVEDLMGAVDQHYFILKRFMRGENVHEGSTVQLMLECAMVANMATESVLAAERALAVQHPHLDSFYRVLALVFLSPMVAEVHKLIKPEKIQNEPHLALSYVAEIVECGFHSRGTDRIPGKVRKFVKHAGVPYDAADELARQINLVTNIEVMLPQEERLNTQMVSVAQRLGLTPHSWFSRSPYVGGDRCILNTQNITQMVFDLVQDQNKLIGKPGFWGELFDEHHLPALRIRGDMDEAFAANILPELITICLHAPFKCLPERTQLLTILDLLSAQLQGNRDEPIPLALSFGLHAMLTSIFVVQGQGHLAQIATSLKGSFHKLFSQLEARSDTVKEPKNHPNFYVNVNMFRSVALFAKHIGDVGTRESLAIWNPVVGGSYLLYATYMCSIGLGSATVDSLGQLRFTLHLYNALKQQHLIKEEDVPFLRDLDKTFDKCRAVWVGHRPNKGNFAKQFWVAWGKSLAEASRCVSEANDDQTSSFLKTVHPQGLDSTR